MNKKKMQIAIMVSLVILTPFLFFIELFEAMFLCIIYVFAQGIVLLSHSRVKENE